MKNRKSAQMIISMVLAISIISGCEGPGRSNESAKYYYMSSNKNISNIGRIAIVELQNDSTYPQMSNDITDALFQSLQKKQVFGLKIFRHNDPVWKSLQLQPDATYSLEQMAAMSKALKCDGVLVGTITEFKPYPHMSVGLRLKLIDLTEGEMLWALEHVWSSSDKLTEQKIKKYLDSTKSSSSNNADERITAISPLEFIKFVSYEIAQTL